MARSVKRPRAEPQAFHQLGVRGRKTGVVLQDRGERDEHGMQPLDSIFSPHVSKPPSSEDESSEDGGSGAMEIASSDGPGPQTLLKNRHSITYPIPKSRSPIKTHLNSPAKKRTHLDYPSSPSRSGLTDDRDVTVTRRLDFADLSRKSRSLGGGDVSHASKSSRPSLQRVQEQVEDDEESQYGVQDLPADPTLVEPRDPTVSDLVNESMDMFDAMKSDNFSAPGFDSPAAYGLAPARRGMNSPAGILQQSPAHPPSMTKPSPLSTISTIQKSQPEQSIYETKKKRSSLEATPAEKGELNEEPPSREEQRLRATNMPPPPRPGISAPARPAMAAPRPIPRPPARETPQMEAKSSRRGRGRPRKTERPPQKRRPEGPEDEDEGDETFMEIQRGPPMPRSRGLVSFRNGGTSAAAGHYQTGRHPSFSNRSADLWGDAAQLGREHELELDLGLEPNVRNVVRLASDALPSARAPRSKTRTKARQNVHIAVEEDEEMEDWERDEGKVMGDIVLWEPEHEFFPPGDDEEVRVTQDRLAIAADAIEVKDIPDASFRFAKTLTVPFMGAGVVDLPSHTMKRPKNSRRMHMVFFLHYGKVQVIINDAQFRISAGGTWFVPRGNYYSITNDYDFPARIFFAQACEVAPQASEGTPLAGEATSAGAAAAPEKDGDGDEED